MVNKAKLKQELAEEALTRRERDHEREINALKIKLAKSEARRKQSDADNALLGVVSELWGELTGVGIDHKPFKPKKPSGSATAVICINDVHCEETVLPETVNGLGEFNLDIAEKRLAKVGHNALLLLDAQRKMSNIRDLVVWIGGDIISGHIHEELTESNSLSPTEACLWAEQQLIGLLDHWLAYADVDSLTVVTSYGNHGRTVQKPRIGTAAKHSFEWWMYKHLERVYLDRADKRVTFKVEQSYHNWLEIQGKQVRFHHGDWLKYQGGVGGIGIPVNKSINEWNKAQRADFDFFGHWHQHEKHAHWCACNCLIGYNAYAQSIKASWSEPSQTFAVFDRDRRAPVLVQEIYCT